MHVQKHVLLSFHTWKTHRSGRAHSVGLRGARLALHKEPKSHTENTRNVQHSHEEGWEKLLEKNYQKKNTRKVPQKKIEGTMEEHPFWKGGRKLLEKTTGNVPQ